MPIRVQDDKGNIHVFPDGSTPEMIAGAMGVQVSTQKVPQGQLDQIRQLNADPTQFEQSGGRTGNERFSDATPETSALARAANYIRGGVSTITAPLLHPVETIQGMGQGLIAGGATPYGTPITAPTGNQQIDQQNEKIHRDAQNQAIASGADAIKNNPAYLAGQLTAPLALGAALKSPLVRVAVADRVAPLVAGVKELVPNVPSTFKAPFPSKVTAVMPETNNLPPLAVEGVEHIFRASAPTGMNKGFRANLNVAAGDLAEIGQKVDMNAAKGGIVNPDFRVRATVDAIRTHLDDMYNQERVPQIQRNADVPVKVGNSADAIRGLEYLENTAGQEQIRALATKALGEVTKTDHHGNAIGRSTAQPLTLAEADTLAQAANQNLKNFEKMTPEGKTQAQITNPKIGGLKSLDMELGRNLNDALLSQGEPGLRLYERRFAALSAVRDALEARQNAVELQRQNPIKKIGGYLGAKKAIASASQAAVADENIGRMLQKGFAKLRDSGVTASR